MNRRRIYLFFHFNFILGMTYAGVRVLTTSRTLVLQRRLWAFEYWIIFGFYAVFVLLSMVLLEERKLSLKQTIRRLLRGELRIRKRQL